MTAPSLGLTSYSEQLAGYAGMIADMFDGKYIVAARNSDTSQVPFGAGVVRDTDASTPGSAILNAKLPSTTGQRCYGVVAHSHDYENGTNGTLGTIGLKTDATMNVVRRGMMYVNVEDACTENVALFLRYTVNGGNNPGNWRSDADTSKADKCVGVTPRTTIASGGGLVLAQVDMPAYDAVKE